jgi:hypothetical protein
MPCIFCFFINADDSKSSTLSLRSKCADKKYVSFALISHRLYIRNICNGKRSVKTSQANQAFGNIRKYDASRAIPYQHLSEKGKRWSLTFKVK